MPRSLLRIAIAAAIALSGIASVVAEELSPEADQAFWCAAAFAAIVNSGAFGSAEHQQTALADLARFEPVMQAEGARLGWDENAVRAVALSYSEEVNPQIADYLQGGGASALRLSLPECFPSLGL